MRSGRKRKDGLLMSVSCLCTMCESGGKGESVRLDRCNTSDTGEDEVCTLRVCGRGEGEQGRDGRKRVCTAVERSAEDMTG